jgi:hypothetical protein
MSTPVNAVFVSHGEVHATAAPNSGIELVGERSTDELEGSLLPVATHVHVVNDNTTAATTTNNAMAAVPVQVFEYDEAMAKEQQEELRRPLLQQEQSCAEDVTEVVHAVPLAAAPHLAHPESIADDSRLAVNLAQYTAMIRAEEEFQAIRNANRKVYSQNYWQSQSIQAANKVARRRDQEGLQIKDDHLSPASSPLRSSVNCHKSETSEEQQDVKPKGYHVQEYQIEDDYETSPYEVQEYKSVYD